jgi:hypothetical protein
MPTIIGGGEEIQPIEWKQYVGETVNTNLIIRKGKKIQETAFYEDKVKAVPRGNAYCIGNGPSRKGFDLNKLKATGQTYGCNALYRDFVPDFIFSVDTKMTLKMCEDKVYEKCIHYAPALEVNRPYSKNKLHLTPNNPHWISGNQAFWTAAVHGHKNIYLIGFDFREYGKDQLNNIYQDTENYGKRHSDIIFEVWLTQFRQIQKMRPYCNWVVVHDDPPEYLKVSNPSANFGKFKILNYKEFTAAVLNYAV